MYTMRKNSSSTMIVKRTIKGKAARGRLRTQFMKQIIGGI